MPGWGLFICCTACEICPAHDEIIHPEICDLLLCVVWDNMTCKSVSHRDLLLTCLLPWPLHKCSARLLNNITWKWGAANIHGLKILARCENATASRFLLQVLKWSWFTFVSYQCVSQCSIMFKIFKYLKIYQLNLCKIFKTHSLVIINDCDWFYHPSYEKNNRSHVTKPRIIRHM